MVYFVVRKPDWWQGAWRSVVHDFPAATIIKEIGYLPRIGDRFTLSFFGDKMLEAVTEEAYRAYAFGQ